MFKKRRKNFYTALFLMLVCLAFNVYNYNKTQRFDDDSLDKMDTKMIVRSKNSNGGIDKRNTTRGGKCNPIRGHNNLQYKVNIDGVVYPQYVPSYFDRSIDFDCLNNRTMNQRAPVILFWNPFYGNRSYYVGLGKINDTFFYLKIMHI
jgi:hypothetical protein